VLKPVANDYAVFSRLLDEGLDRPAEQRRSWLSRLPPDYAAFKPRLERLLLVHLSDEAGDLIPVAQLLHAALLDLAAFKDSMNSQRETRALAAKLLDLARHVAPGTPRSANRLEALARAASAISVQDDLAAAMREQLLRQLIERYREILRDAFSNS
jgi:hypothetical protein